MKILDTKFVQGFIKMANDGYLQGWHERNGGNLSYRLKTDEVESIRPRLMDHGQWHPIGASVPGVAGEFFLVTGTGKYFRNIIVDPEASIAIIEIDEKGENYRIRWGLVEGGLPTSELPTHLLNHEVKKRTSGGVHRVIYHAHTTNVIALSFVLPLQDEIFTRELWEMATECPVVFPKGVGVIGWMVPGGRDIALATSRLMEQHDYDAVIWAHHGMFCSGETFDLTFGLMHTIEKSAEILVKVMSMGGRKLQTIRPDDFRALEPQFHIELPERFLYEKEDPAEIGGPAKA
ncbi:MAG: rhamnulose-1-phosphate aldolase [Eubacteriales bacterium]|nr:rhamnulose-1-phosphate aldolase [Eubacteriales bacterium]